MKDCKIEPVNGMELSNYSRAQKTAEQPSAAEVSNIKVKTQWEGGTRSQTRVVEWKIGETVLARDTQIAADGLDRLEKASAPNPQELILAAFNACMIMGYAAGCAKEGIILEKLVIETEGELDLRGLLGLDPAIKPGYDELRYTVRIQGHGTREQFLRIHQLVMATSPNRWNLANSVKLKTEFIVECPHQKQTMNLKR